MSLSGDKDAILGYCDVFNKNQQTSRNCLRHKYCHAGEVVDKQGDRMVFAWGEETVDNLWNRDRSLNGGERCTGRLSQYWLVKSNKMPELCLDLTDRHQHDYILMLIIIILYVLDMMTSSNGNVFRVTGHLCGKFTGHRWIPRAN